jgi:CheY-like chemotaxis protein
MSHELRTPLNSLLILSKLLSQNPEGNLTPQQTEYAGTIHSAGSDLLALINEILDLAKIESGTMEVDVRSLPFANLKDYVERNFRPLAEDKGMEFAVQLAPDLPPAISTDPQRLQQVVRNLLSNAFKFTEAGSVGLRIGLARHGWSHANEALNRADTVIAFSVTDTGIGIPPDKHKVIFEAFQQADGTTSRKYGGTGLGLSISREIAALLHGEIVVDSKPGVGSTFTLYLPREYPASRRAGRAGEGQNDAGNGAPRRRQPPAARIPAGGRDEHAATAEATLIEHRPPATGPSVSLSNPTAARGLAPADDRGRLEPGDRVLLIIDDDPPFAGIVSECAKSHGFKVIVASEGESGLALARELKPSAITLDVALPGMNGWAVLDRLKHDPALRHIPVHVVSATEDTTNCAMKQGARGFLQKSGNIAALEALLTDINSFIERFQRTLLVVEDDENQSSSIAELVGGDDVEVTQVRGGEEAIEAMRSRRFDCIVVDLGLPGMSGFELIDAMRRDASLRSVPVVVYTARDVSRAEQEQLRASAEAVIIKDAHSPERLLDETSLFLHRVEANLPPNKRKMIEQARLNDPALQGIRVLIIDDDVRNVFALTAALEHRFGMRVIYADNGADGIEQLKSSAAIDVVLMDVMMPGMDGYETTRQIRQLPGHETIPIIALTAKAMKGDREKCLEAGASDYIAKPVDTDQLASLIRVWVGERKCEPQQQATNV